MSFDLKKYSFICPSGHVWLRMSYRTYFVVSICPRCGKLGTVRYCYGKV